MILLVECLRVSFRTISSFLHIFIWLRSRWLPGLWARHFSRCVMAVFRWVIFSFTIEIRLNIWMCSMAFLQWFKNSFLSSALVIFLCFVLRCSEVEDFFLIIFLWKRGIDFPIFNNRKVFCFAGYRKLNIILFEQFHHRRIVPFGLILYSQILDHRIIFFVYIL